MSNKLQRLRGMRDLMPSDCLKFAHIIKMASKIADSYYYQMLMPPLLEYSKIFDRTLGDLSDVVSKEMYNFTDKSGDSISLRPEFTAGIMRAVIENSLFQKLPARFFSFGPLFRYDRPGSGRQRQFHQLNFEYLGAKTPVSDAELIKLAFDLISSFKISFKLEINSLGCNISYQNYNQKLIDYFTKYQNDLSADSLKRLEKNPLRILDSKDQKDKQIVENAPLISSSYTNEAKLYFEKLLNFLDKLSIKYVINERIVRGLDYYCHTTFEFISDSEILGGNNSAILAGGRYDGLSGIMGGPEIPAIGFAAGIERIALLMDNENIESKKLSIVILPIAQSNISAALKLTDILRAKANIAALLLTEGKIGKRLEFALKEGAKYAIFIGDEEEEKQNFKVKMLELSLERYMSLTEILNMLESLRHF